MKTIKMRFIIFLVLGFFWVNHNNPCYAQKPMNTLIILYSNNINGEVEPCPT
jgi:hypothetical protein